MLAKTIRSNDNSEEGLKASKNNNDSEHSRMSGSDEYIIISDIKTEETQIENNDIFENQQEVKNQENGKATDLKCRSCDYVTESLYNLVCHQRTNHFPKRDFIKCPLCPFDYWLKNEILRHMKTKHKEVFQTLNAEDKRKLQSSTINEEASTSSGVQLIPVQREEQFSSDDNITLYELVMPSTSISKDQIEQTEEESSDDEFRKKLLNFRKQQRIKRPQLKLTDRRKCYECGKICNSYAAFLQHEASHMTDEKKFACTHCEKKFMGIGGLKRHFVICHEFKQVIKCTSCSFVAESAIQLKIHFKESHMEMPFQCDKCPKKFARQELLRQHSFTHSGLKFKCDICPMMFVSKSELYDHQRWHTKKEHACEYCGKLVKYMSRHLKTCWLKKSINFDNTGVLENSNIEI